MTQVLGKTKAQMMIMKKILIFLHIVLLKKQKDYSRTNINNSLANKLKEQEVQRSEEINNLTDNQIMPSNLQRVALVLGLNTYKVKKSQTDINLLKFRTITQRVLKEGNLTLMRMITVIQMTLKQMKMTTTLLMTKTHQMRAQRLAEVTIQMSLLVTVNIHNQWSKAILIKLIRDRMLTNMPNILNHLDEFYMLF